MLFRNVLEESYAVAIHGKWLDIVDNVENGYSYLFGNRLVKTFNQYTGP